MIFFFLESKYFQNNVFEYILKYLYFVFTSIAIKYFVFVLNYFIVSVFRICI